MASFVRTYGRRWSSGAAASLAKQRETKTSCHITSLISFLNLRLMQMKLLAYVLEYVSLYNKHNILENILGSTT